MLSAPPQPPCKVVVVHRGARDAYQVARALHDSGQLETVVTDLFWAPASLLARVESWLPSRFRSQLRARAEPHLPCRQVKSCTTSGLFTLVVEKSRRVPFTWKRAVTRWMDHVLGRTAGRLATQLNSALLSYSYYGHSAFSNFKSRNPKILFQLHPHPASVRRILTAELHRHPECAASLRQEWELALPEEDYRKLVEETRMAGAWIAASSFTKQTLVENGLSRKDIHVVPYGVDLQKFRPAECPTLHTGRLRLLFVGRINQRKGLKYLLEALRLVSTRQVELVICGRVLDDLSMLAPFRSQVIVRASVTHEQLLEAYQRAELFAFPSLVEGFGHVLLEALACGLPVLSTTQTAAPDLLTEGVDGFIIPPSRPDSLANRIEWALDNRRELFAMKADARLKAEQFTWERFRSRVGQIVKECCANAM